MGWDEPVLLRAISKDLSEERMFKVKPKKQGARHGKRGKGRASSFGVVEAFQEDRCD